MNSSILRSCCFVFTISAFSICTIPGLAAGVGDMSYYKRAAFEAFKAKDLEAGDRLMYKLRLKTRQSKSEPKNSVDMGSFSTQSRTSSISSKSKVSTDAADAFLSLADLFAEKGRVDDMRSCMKDAIRIRESIDGPGSAAVIALLSHMAGQLISQRRSAEAYAILDECIRVGTMSSTQNLALEPVYAQLAEYYASIGTFQRAKTNMIKAVEIARKRAGSDAHVNSQTSAESNITLSDYLFKLSLYCNGTGNTKESEDYARECAQLAEKYLPLRNKRRAADEANLAIILKNNGKKEEAKKISRQLKDALGQSTDEDSLNSIYTVGVRFLADRCYEEAEPFVVMARNGFIKEKGSADPQSLQASCNLAQILAARHNLAASEKIIAQMDASRPGAARLSGTPLFDCNHEFERAQKYFLAKQQFPIAQKLGRKQLDFLTASSSCPSCAHLCLPDCYKSLAQSSRKLGDSKNADKYTELMLAIKGPAPRMK